MNRYLNIATLFLLLSGCKKTSANNLQPAASISNLKIERTTTDQNLLFNVVLSKPAANDATINYKTIDGTAKGGRDFISSAGLLTISKGRITAQISIVIKGDSIRRDNRQFFVQLFNARNCILINAEASGIIIDENNLSFPVDNSGYTTPVSYPGYRLVWSDEFDGKQINSNNWSYEIGNNGWGNNELESYTNSTKNSFVSNGNLIIEARHDQLGSNNYSSARMITKGKRSFKFGRIDIRAKLPKGQGIWPALWLLGSNIDNVNWPACGEIDMMELLGQDPAKIYGTLHWGLNVSDHKSFGTSYVLNAGTFDQEFHVFSMEWKKDSIKLYVDDVLFFSASSSNITGVNPFNNTFYLLLNVAVGGNWPGNPDGTTVWPQRMIVDYVRVFQL